MPQQNAGKDGQRSRLTRAAHLATRARSTARRALIEEPGQVRRPIFEQSTQRGLVVEWAVPPANRVPLDIGKGDTSKMFSALQEIAANSQGAALAVTTLVAQEPIGSPNEKARSRAGNERSRLLRTYVPNAASLRSVRNRLQEVQGSSRLDRLSAELEYWTEQYLRLEHGLPTQHSIREIANGLGEVANGFAETRNGTRESSARAMCAATLLVGLGEFSNAIVQMRRMFVLFRENYKDIMLQLFEDIESPRAEELIVTGQPTTRVGQFAGARA